MQKINFVPFGTELLEWAGEKDRRYFTASKMGKGMASYTSALHDLGFFFKKVCTGQLSPNSQPVSAWARAWSWDWRKALRFITRVLRDLFELNVALKKAKILRDRIQAAYAKQQEKARNYMRHFRGSMCSKTYADELESADERLFLDAMVELYAKNSPTAYREKIKKQLHDKDVGTVTNFQNWIQKNLKKDTLVSIDSIQVEEILKNKLVLGYRVIDFQQKSNDIYHLVFENYFENDMTVEQIIEHAQ